MTAACLAEGHTSRVMAPRKGHYFLKIDVTTYITGAFAREV